MPVETQKTQYNIRISSELKERLVELGRPLGLTGNEFAAEALEKYSEVLAEVMAAEREAHQQVSEEHKRQIRERFQSPRR
jgi:predicted DNA-binding protein